MNAAPAGTQALGPGSARQLVLAVLPDRDVEMSAVPDRAGDDARREAGPPAVPARHGADEVTGKDGLVAGGDRIANGERELHLPVRVLGMHLLYLDP